MEKRNSLNPVAALCAALVALVLVSAAAGQTESAERPPRWGSTDDSVVLARMGLLEAGEDVAATELAAMRQVIDYRANRAGGQANFRSTAWQFSRGLRNPRRAWVHNLGRSPLQTSRIRGKWERILVASDAVFAGEQQHNCVTETGEVASLTDWGGPRVDRESLDSISRRTGWRRAICPGAANEYLHEPRE